MQGNEKHVSLNVYANEIVVYDEIKKKRIATYLKTSLLSVSPLGYQNPCEVLFINNDGQFGIQITDKATGNMGFITIKKDSTIYANVRINNVWGTERHL